MPWVPQASHQVPSAPPINISANAQAWVCVTEWYSLPWGRWSRKKNHAGPEGRLGAIQEGISGSQHPEYGQEGAGRAWSPHRHYPLTPQDSLPCEEEYSPKARSGSLSFVTQNVTQPSNISIILELIRNAESQSSAQTSLVWEWAL